MPPKTNYDLAEGVCRQCFQDYTPPNVAFAEDDGFCSDACMVQYEKELLGLDVDEEEE